MTRPGGKGGVAESAYGHATLVWGVCGQGGAQVSRVMGRECKSCVVLWVCKKPLPKFSWPVAESGRVTECARNHPRAPAEEAKPRGLVRFFDWVRPVQKNISAHVGTFAEAFRLLFSRSL